MGLGRDGPWSERTGPGQGRGGLVGIAKKGKGEGGHSGFDKIKDGHERFGYCMRLTGGSGRGKRN